VVKLPFPIPKRKPPTPKPKPPTPSTPRTPEIGIPTPKVYSAPKPYQTIPQQKDWRVFYPDDDGDTK
jgi:hypothetical protein